PRAICLDLSKVCARWHAIIMNNPPLLVVLARSGTYPLDLEIAAATSFSGEIGPRSISSRWRRAFLNVDTVAETALASIQGRLPLLEKLEFPARRSLNLRLTFSGDASSLPELTWSQLDFLRLCMTIRRGSVADNRLEIGVMLDSLTLLNLRKLHIGAGSVLPVSRCAIRFGIRPLSPHWRPRSAFAASLTFLSIISIISDAELLSALRELPNLERWHCTPISDILLLGLGGVDDRSQRLALAPKASKQLVERISQLAANDVLGALR
ncbi:hypothetical protein C8F01DRAFT_1193826, partial [Mycena amicta]